MGYPPQTETMDGLRRRVNRLARRDTQSLCREALSALALRGRPRKCHECRRLEALVAGLLADATRGGRDWEMDRTVAEVALRSVKCHVDSIAHRQTHSI